MRNCVLLLLLGSLLVLGCTQTPTAKPASTPPEVLVTKASTQMVVDYEEFTGHIEAKYSIEVKALVSGNLEKVCFKDGSTVKEGDVLFEIDPRPFDAEQQRAEGVLKQAEFKFKRLAENYRRAVMQKQAGAISPEDFDKVSGDRAEAEASVGVAQADLKKAKLNVEYSKITVPIFDKDRKPDPANPRTGLVGRRMKDPGNYIEAGKTVLTTIVTLDPMFVYFDIDERTVNTLRKRKIKSISEMDFRFELANDDGKYPYEGKINFENNKLDSGTGTLELRGEFKNTHGLSAGQFVRLRL